jgi:ATP-dependent DNA ligase
VPWIFRDAAGLADAAKSVPAIPGGAMSYEPKWDGFRSVIFRDGDEVEIGSRNERPMTRYFPEIVAAVRASLPGRSVIDGEIVIPDADGRCLDFEALLQRIHPADSRVRLLAERPRPRSLPSTCPRWATPITPGSSSRCGGRHWRGHWPTRCPRFT